MLRDERRTLVPKRAGVTVMALVFALSAAIFSLLSFLSWKVFDDSEERLLQQRTDEAAVVLEIAVVQVRGPLDSAARVALTTDGASAPFEEVMREHMVDGGGLFS